MKAMIMAAGLGTRLKPWTLEHPKALVPVEGIPVLARIILKLRNEGFDRIVVNVHHFSGQIVDFLSSHDFDVKIEVSDESARLLDTGGALRNAYSLLAGDDEPVLVHNVDILSNEPLDELVRINLESGADITLLTSLRDSSRRLLFRTDDTLAGWHNLTTDQYRPAGFRPEPDMVQEAFSGIYVVGQKALADIVHYGDRIGDDKFPIMDYLLSVKEDIVIRRHCNPKLRMLDIGKPDALRRAAEYL